MYIKNLKTEKTMNLLKTIQSHQEKQVRITEIVDELDNLLQEGSAEHFIQWHNSKATQDRHISPSWYNLYLTENGKQ